ncbi:MAG: hypothetical protein MR364_04425 [Oscillospiraceae bacterium]|nr:hypothetical protein [Oscillospiraceae bacterium]
MDSVQTVTYQCPNCNAALEYDNILGGFRCFYCDSTFSENEIKKIFAERDNKVDLETEEPELTEQQMTDEEFTGQSALYTCPNCGAGVICDSLTSSTRCHFCHTPVILSGRLSGEYKPDVIIPFSTTREQAEEKFRDFAKGKFLLPNDFQTEVQIKNISALYVPYWLKSGQTTAHLTAVGHTVRSWTTGNTTYVHTKVYDVQRDADFVFVRVPYDGSKRIDDSLMESIEPFDYSGIKPFSMSYLSGCAAEKYDVSKEEAAPHLDARIGEAAQKEIVRMASVYSSLNSVQCDISYTNQQYVYALLPVWFLNYNYKGKDYEFAMNGQTGSMFGELPISSSKKNFFKLGIFLIAFIIMMLIGGIFFG